jgi:hypothetical protein
MTSKQSLFKLTVPRNMFMNFLYNVATITDEGYIYDHESYKRGNICVDNDTIPNDQFCEDILLYYYKHKQFYVTRKNAYNKFTTLIRQLCHLHGIDYKISSGNGKSKALSSYHIKI